MPLLKASDQQALREELQKMTNPVRLIYFTQALDCETCGITKQILEEVAALSDKLELVTYNFAIDREAVNRYGIARIPATAIVRLEVETTGDGPHEAVERDYGIRFYGVPSGYEFMALIGDLLDVSSGESGLAPESKTLLAQVTEPLHFQVFTTPT
jgi:alkyl hydroperoxide reductase subunit AhpF